MRTTTIIKVCSLGILAVGLALLAGCSAVGKMPIEYDNWAKAQKPASEDALVYIVRPSNQGKAVLFKVTCDGNPIGATGGARYIFTKQPPGPHLFVSKAENKSELPIVLEGGKTYYLEQKVKMGLLKARNNLERLDDAEGIEKLARCSLSEDTVADIPGAEAYQQQLRDKKAEAASRKDDDPE